MSWLGALDAELKSRRVPMPERRRILLELGDHIVSERGCEPRLGDPTALARTFADELATSRTKRSALLAVLALSVAAGALLSSQLALGGAGGYPAYSSGDSVILFALAVLGIFVAPQVGLVTGVLAAWRVLLRRRALVLPAAELALVARRTRLALLAGLATAIGSVLYAADFSARQPAWWLVLTLGTAAAAAAALIAALLHLRRWSGVDAGGAGPAGDIRVDLPPLRHVPLLRRTWWVGTIGSLVAGAAVVAFTAHAESSLLEGLQRGGAEAIAAFAGFVALGRTVGLRPARD